MEGHKVLPSDILHKSDIGGVCLGESDRAAAETAFDEILAASFAAEPDAAIDGCLVAPMVTGGVETILGVQRDPRARRFATTPVYERRTSPNVARGWKMRTATSRWGRSESVLSR